jgi:hypothetical protein
MPEEQKKLGLLKTFFRRSPRGGWEIQAMRGIYLRPRQNSGREDFFEIADELLTIQPNIAGTTTGILGQSIVPVVAHSHGELEMRCLGTGFFISCSGLLITAAHVITDPITRRNGFAKPVDDRNWRLEDGSLGVMVRLPSLPPESRYIFRSIEWASFLGQRTENPLPITGIDLKLNSDAAVCKVAPLPADVPFQPLAIVQRNLAGVGMGVGKRATAIGYGTMERIPLRNESGRLIPEHLPFDMHVSSGIILERFPDNLVKKHVPSPGPCFSAALRLPHGMSGSPIFDDEGVYVHGVVSTGWDLGGDAEPLGFGSMLAPSMGIPIGPLGDKTLTELHSMDEHGFPKLSGPGL